MVGGMVQLIRDVTKGIPSRNTSYLSAMCSHCQRLHLSIILAPPFPSARTEAHTSSATRAVSGAESAISSSINGIIDYLDHIFFVLQLSDIMILPDMADQGLDVPTNCTDASSLRTQHAGVASVYAVAVAFHHEAVLNSKTAINAVVFYANLPRLARREGQGSFAVRAVW